MDSFGLLHSGFWKLADFVQMMSNSKTLSQRLGQHITSSFHDPIFGMKDSYAILAASSGRSSSSMSSSSRSTSSRSSAPPSPDSVTDAEDHPIGYGAFGVVWYDSEIYIQ